MPTHARCFFCVDGCFLVVGGAAAGRFFGVGCRFGTPGRFMSVARGAGDECGQRSGTSGDRAQKATQSSALFQYSKIIERRPC